MHRQYGEQYHNFLKDLMQITTWCSGPFLYTPPKELEAGIQRDIHPGSYYHIQNSQQVEATQSPSIKEWKQDLVHTDNGILVSAKKERNSDIYFNRDELWEHYAKWIKTVIKGQIILWLIVIYIWFYSHKEEKVQLVTELEKRTVVTQPWGEGEWGIGF